VLGNVADLGLIAYPVKDTKLEIVPLRKEPLVVICHSAASVRQAQDHQAEIACRPKTHRVRAGHPDAPGAGQDFEAARRGSETCHGIRQCRDGETRCGD